MYGREHGSKPGSGGTNSALSAQLNRREVLRQLALERVDLSRDPYIMKNHLGTFDCRLCMTTHLNEGNYLAHTQGRRHQTGLARRAARHASATPGPQIAVATAVGGAGVPQPAPRRPRIGLPHYRYAKQYDRASSQHAILFLIEYPEILPNLQPRFRIMPSYEQRIENTPNKDVQYVVFAAEPYNTIAFKIPNTPIEREVDPASGRRKFWTHWSREQRVFALQIFLRDSPEDIRKDREDVEKNIGAGKSRDLKELEELVG